MSAPNKEIFKNASESTLNGAIDDNDNPITVTTGSQFPATGNFRLIIDSELLLCTARSGNSLTVTRGAEGTTPASHSNGAPVTHIMTAECEERRGRDMDPLWGSSRPAFGVYNDAGDAQLVAADFTAVNLGGSDVVSNQSGTLLLRKASQQGIGNQVTALVRSAPSTPYAYIACFEAFTALTATSIDRAHFGMVFRESSTGELTTFSLSSEGGAANEPFAWLIENHSSPTASPSVSGGFKTLRIVNVSPRLWMRIENDGSDLKYSMSPDGFNWVQLHTMGRTSFMAGGPDQIGWFGNAFESSIELLVRLCHWSKE